MHRVFKELLQSAEGQSQRVVVIFLDIRGFSSFAKIAESSDAAEFLRSAYLRILDDYFAGADFFKPTGDGLLILYKYDRDTLSDAVHKAVISSIELVEEFPVICEGDAMVNFDVPSYLGVGLARGAVTALTSKETVLDYSGRPINLASRLMDLARPSGVVFDDSFDSGVLAQEVRDRFATESVYVKGLAESDPLIVHYLKDRTKIPDYNKSPIDRFERRTEPTETVTLQDLSERRLFRHPLAMKPARTDDINVHISYPEIKPDGAKHPHLRSNVSEPARYDTAKNSHYATFDYRPLVERMTSAGVQPAWKVQVAVEYSIREGASPKKKDSAPSGH
jgi:class 3 adenylate cyclase